MADLTSQWVQWHVVNYERVFEWVLMHPIAPGDFIRSGFVDLLLVQGWKTTAYTRRDETGAYIRDRVKNGEVVKFWNGESVEDTPIDIVTMIVGDYEAIAYKVMDLAKTIGVSPIVIDLGAGLCGQSIALREAGCDFPIFNVDLFPHAIQIGRTVSEALQLADISFASIDVGKAISDTKLRKQLRDVMLDKANGRPIIIVSRYAIHSFYTPAEIKTLVDFLLDDIKAVGGVHLEFGGDRTPTYETLCAQMGMNLPVSQKLLLENEDALLTIAQHPRLRVHQRQEVWPHILSDRFPSYLSWIRE